MEGNGGGLDRSHKGYSIASVLGMHVLHCTVQFTYKEIGTARPEHLPWGH
jgi:hypothetical protein